MQILISMEMDFSEQLVRFPNKIIFICLIILLGCNQYPGNVELTVQFYPNTNDTATIVSHINGLEHGEWRKYYRSGELMEKRYFSKGKKVGVLTNWWENGKIQSEYHFKDGEYDGTCREWNQEGMLIREMNYKKGYESGSQKQWYDDGHYRSNYVIINGRRFGLLGTKNCVNVSDSLDFFR